MPTGTSKLLSIQVILLLINSSNKKVKEHPKTKQPPQNTTKPKTSKEKKSYILMASQICWEEKRTPAETDAQQITQLWYQLDTQDGAISVPAMLHLRQLTAVPVRRKPKEHASIDILRQQNSLHGLYNQEAIITFWPILVSYQVP